MGKWTVFTLVFGFMSMAGTPLLKAADFNYEDYDDTLYKDKSYIDQSLDEFDKRLGRVKPEHDQYADLDESHDYRPKDQKKWQYQGDDDYSLKDPAPEYGDKFQDKWDDRHAHKKHHKNYQHHGRYGRQCMHPGQIRRHLISEGWHDFVMLRQGPRRVRMLARNYDGRQFRLVVQRCHGEIIRVRPVRRHWTWRQRRRHFE